MRKKLMMALTGVALCVALGSGPAAVLAEDDGENLDSEVSLRERMDANGDATLDDTEKAGFREHYRNRFDRNHDGRLDKNERRHARRAFDRAEDRWDRREDIRDRLEDVRDRREDVRDHREDRWDRREDMRDRREDVWDRREDIRDRRDDRLKARHFNRLQQRLANTDDPEEKARLERPTRTNAAHHLEHLTSRRRRDKSALTQ